MDDEARRPGWGTIGAILLVAAAVVLGGLYMMGGQVSTILSNVGNSVTTGNVGTGVGDASGDQAPSDGEAPADTGGQVADAGGAAAQPDLLIIRTGKLDLEVADLARAIAAARTRVLAVGGYVSASDELTSGDRASASAVYRVPAGRWDEALDGVRGLAMTVTQLQVETEAVTSQVVDLGARITNLRVSEAALQRIMAQAIKIADVLSVQAELTKVRGEIERLVAEKGLLEERAAFGTLTVTFNLPATPATEEVRRGWDPAVDADRATGALISVGQSATSAGIWLAIVGLPLLIVGLIIVLVTWRIARFVSRRAVQPRPS